MSRSVLAIVAIGLLAGLVFGAYETARRQPVYVGVRACAACHDGAGMGYQCSLWQQSKHARAYAVLARPEAKAIAELSGIPQEPQSSPMCLGCHATGAHAEDWEKDETFRVEDGVQCEHCHGPGSEYMTESVMRDRERAMAAGLIMPAARDCMICHEVKGSHVALHDRTEFDVLDGLKKIAHPTPGKSRLPQPRRLPQGGSQSDLAAHVGIFACAECHKGPDKGYQFSKWRMSAHQRAFAVLATEKAYQIAKEQGIQGPPSRSESCLKCHATTHCDPAGGQEDTYSIYEGVGCEACHGAGSRHAEQARRANPQTPGLKDVTKQTCLGCHENAHGKPFDYEQSLARIAHPTKIAQTAEKPRYKTPLNLALSPDGSELYVACEASHTVIVVDLARRQKVAEIAVGGHPTDVAFTPDGRRAYVSNRLDDTVSIVDVAERKRIGTIPVGDEPHGVLTDRAGKVLYVLNTSSDSISVIDLATHQEIKRLAASRGPWSLSLSPDGSQVYITNTLSRFVPFRSPSVSEVTILDTRRNMIEDRRSIPGANLLQGVAWHPSGEFALITLNRTKNLVPMTRLLQGWTITNGLGILWNDGRVDQILLDDPHLAFPDPTDVAVTPDGRWALVTSSGSNRLGVVDVRKMIAMLEAASVHDREHVFPNHLGKSTEFVVRHIPLEHSPRGLLITPDGKTAFVANALDDSLTAIDLDRWEPVARIDLGGPKEITTVRLGERIFHSADNTFQRQFSCHTCHPDGHIDGLTYDIEPDGIGFNPVDNRTLRGILDTAPFKWEGTNPSLQRQCGPRPAVFFTRIQPFTPEQITALDTYICTIPRPPNRYRPLGAPLTDAQRRGKAMFERTRTNDGRVIPKEDRCITCHSPPLYTDRQRHDVGTKMQYDRESEFDVPHLNNIYDSAPYLHNGIAATLEEIWTVYNPDDRHGVTNDMTKDQLNDLIEYLKTL